ncbi:MAG: FmdB family transcriptional regulator [Acidimicrobiia bacterium]|nr:FmdB family transcriptional regulator [Acidimicrobiia bacterium]
MPTYEYRCKDCGEHLEVHQSFDDDPLTECPACGGQLRKKFAAVGIAFKGSGFYKNDSRSNGGGSGSPSTTTTKTSTSEGGSSDSGSKSDSSTSTASTDKASSSSSKASTSSSD